MPDRRVCPCGSPTAYQQRGYCSPTCRFWAKVNKQEGGCWTWLAGRTTGGYGEFHAFGRHVSAHRFAYAELIGSVPDGLHLDHLCRNPLCVNPDHLEPVPAKENVLRGAGPTAVNASKTHCIHGHEFNRRNTHLTPDGKRVCRTCNRDRHRAAYRKKETTDV